MPDHPKPADCTGCIFNTGGECRRYPKLVICGPYQIDGEWFPVEYGFPPSGQVCGEFKRTDLDQLTR